MPTLTATMSTGINTIPTRTKGGFKSTATATASGTRTGCVASAQSAAKAKISFASATSNRGPIGTWYLSNGSLSTGTTATLGNAYSDEGHSNESYSYTTTSLVQNISSWTATVKCTCTYSLHSARTSYDRCATFALDPSSLKSGTLTLTHGNATNFPIYVAVCTKVGFINDLSTYTYQSATLNGTSTTITLSSTMISAIRNSGTFILNIGKYYPDGGVKSNYHGTTTLTAVSLSYELNAVSLTYNANGGTGAPASQVLTPGVAATLSSTKPTRTGYTFLGWSTSSTATSATYNAGDSITISADTILYAVWRVNTYIITYNANGGTGSASQSVDYGATWTSNSGSGFSRTGYTLNGWSLTADGEVHYGLGAAQSVWSTTSDLTLYAVWAIQTYTITYNPGANGTGNAQTQTKTYNVSLTLKGAIFTRPGYTQTGWATSDGGSSTYALAASYTANAALTLYPVWTANTSHTVYFNANGGSVSTASKSVLEGGYYGTLPTPTYGQKEFKGWYTAEVGGNRITETSIFKETTNQTLFAHWENVLCFIYCDRYNCFIIRGGNDSFLTKYV